MPSSYNHMPGVTTYQFIGVFRPGQVADLRACVSALQWLPGQRVPEANATVSSAAP